MKKKPLGEFGDTQGVARFGIGSNESPTVTKHADDCQAPCDWFCRPHGGLVTALDVIRRWLFVSKNQLAIER